MTLASTLKHRRRQLAKHLDTPVMLWSGQATPRNFPANTHPFRSSSHFLYFAGLPLENAVIHLADGRLTLFMDEATPAQALWHGPSPTRTELAHKMGADKALPLDDLKHFAGEVATLKVQDSATAAQQETILNRSIPMAKQSQEQDLALLQAIVQLRMGHDSYALAEIRRAAGVSVTAHKTGMAATLLGERLGEGLNEAHIRAAMEQVIMAQGMTCAYNSIVTVHGEVLHNNHYCHPLGENDLILADVGAETETGWASDITRTWPTGGQFSSTQRALYNVVLAAHDACIAAAKPGVEYRELHLLACRTLAAGLVDLGILLGAPDDLVDQDAHALFFPHGVGHLLGLDVHDMEDLGDLAGYAPGRSRSDRFGLGFLRLDRPLQAGMVITIEPGFYQVPGILADRGNCDRYATLVNWDRLAQFADVRGIRIENDVLITEDGCEVLTADLPTAATAIEQLVGNR
ncbi:aminopeptidase P family protein [Leptolyngbya cf. ectocarpi LEGE 11479]|uniref:Xaa-Pro aminopeptidase n=1 Tax=Leptolyngbya cf. ectocarpi LEGE 11479 TaxID=1828722 RepID=A0A929FC04_LEPEC|nr:aminopeptidase P family protein [Leptolyngbya ectocarpi]MBE9069592.1 aminopeptidase P family protein [Leptolyngbya cf. ectocarpi LEGE 11479]